MKTEYNSSWNQSVSTVHVTWGSVATSNAPLAKAWCYKRM